jgi:small ligand-binding sensory domain FIST
VVEDGLQERGLSGVLFAAQQPIFSSHSQGCTPISEKLSIDEVQQNRVLRLDGRVIRGGLYISCVGRGRRQFGTNSEEPKLIAVGLTLFL